MRRNILSSAVLLAFSMAGSALGATPVAPPAMYPATIWQGRTTAVIRVLDRLDSHLETLTVPVGGSASYHSLNVAVERCVSRPETLPADSAALLHLKDATDETRPPFDGWMLAQEPAVATYGSPLYDVRVISCGGETVAPQAGPLPVTKAPQLTDTSVPEEEGGDDRPDQASPDGGAVPLAPDSHTPIPLAPPVGGAPSLAPAAPATPSAPRNGQPLPPPEADPGLE